MKDENLLDGKEYLFKIPDKKKLVKKPVKKKKAKKKRAKKPKKAPEKISFYKSREWRELRYRVIVKHKAECMACGRSPRKHGIVIHVDHIKPRIKYPHLELKLDNLQLLCEDCNLGKSYKNQTDWRPYTEQELELLIEIDEHNKKVKGKL